MKLLKPKFWDKNYLTSLSILLYPFTFLIDIKNLLTFFIKPKKYSKIKTICVGNIYLGGTGKTPLVNLITRELKKKFKSVIIKKGYLSHLDEKRLLEKNNKVFFEKNRQDSLVKAIKEKFQLAIFDDGLQDKTIDYDLKIVCFNSITLAGNQLRLPAGPLREKLNNLRKYDAVFITGNRCEKEFLKKIKKINPKISIFNGEYVCSNFLKYKKNKYLIFSGIGNPQSFENTLLKYKINFKLSYIYPDHYYYSKEDIIKIKKDAKKNNLKLLTTEKDFYRIPIKLRNNINYIKINLKIKRLYEFNNFINKYL